MLNATIMGVKIKERGTGSPWWLGELTTLVMTKFMCSPWRPLPEPQKWFYSKATCGELWLRDKSHVHRDTVCDRAGTKSPQSFLLCYRPLMSLELRMMWDPEWGKHGLICKTERFSWLDSFKVCVLTSMNSSLITSWIIWVPTMCQTRYQHLGSKSKSTRTVSALMRPASSRSSVEAQQESQTIEMGGMITSKLILRVGPAYLEQCWQRSCSWLGWE